MLRYKYSNIPLNYGHFLFCLLLLLIIYYKDDILEEYDTLLWNELGGELRTSSKLADLAKYSFLLNFVISRAVRNKGVRDIISGMLSQEISKDDLSKPSFYFKILFS